jgi:hypothetical protein
MQIKGKERVGKQNIKGEGTLRNQWENIYGGERKGKYWGKWV